MKLLPKRPLNENDLRSFAAKYLTNFRGVFMRDELPLRPHLNECGILNLQTSREGGSHWVAWYKKKVTHPCSLMGSVTYSVQKS